MPAKNANPLTAEDEAHIARLHHIIANAVVKHDPPPIPDRSHDYQAYLPGREECATGTGPTEGAALTDLVEQLELKGFEP